MKAALDLMLFLVGGIAAAGAAVAVTTVAVCTVSGAGCWYLMRRHRQRRG